MTLAIARADTLNATAAPADARQLTLAADNAPIRVTYGRDRIGGQLVNVIPYVGLNVVVQVLWGYALDAVEKVWVNDAEITSGVTHYTGSQTTPNAMLVAAFAAKGVTYTDTLAGLAYSVIVLPADSFSGSLNVVGLVRGRKIYDPRQDAASNLTINSEDFSASSWGKSGSSVTQNEATAPDGTTTADKLIESATTAVHYIQRLETIPANTLHTCSFYAKAAERSVIQLFFDDGATDGAYANFDLSAGTTPGSVSKGGTNHAASITSVGSGWYRCALSCVVDATSTSIRYGVIISTSANPTFAPSYAGNGTSGVRLWGGQLRAGSAAGAYVRTGSTIGTQVAATPSTWTWSENPSLCLADFLTNTTYGAGRTVDYDSVIEAANWNDTALAVGEPHRKIGLTLAASQAVSSWIDTLRTYAGLYLSRRGGTYYAVQDKATSSVATYAHADGTVAGWSNLQKADLGNSPTLVEIVYTDTAQVPWRDRSAFAKLPGVDTGTVPYRLSTVRLPGIQRYSQAYREAVERLNKLQDDLSLTLRIFDKGIAHEVGDVVKVSLPVGLTEKEMRVAEPPQSTAPGEWELRLREYDPASYSLSVVTAPTYTDTNLPAPTAVPALTSCTASEEIYQGENGLWFSRAKIVITAPEYLWFATYQFEVYDGLTLIHAGTSTQTTYRSPPLQDGPTYTCKARMVSVVGSVGAWSQATFACIGKLAPPSDVPSITGFEVGGDIYLAWQPAVDIDIWRYELRYSSTGGSWATSTLLDRVDALRYISKGIVPAGTWKFWVKALDSVGNYSANAASVTITVTVDPESLQTENYYTSPTLTNMSAYQPVRGGPTWYITDPDAAGDKFGAQFTNSLGTYTNVLASYHTSATSTWQSEAFDFGVSLAGDWQCEATIEALSGSYTLTLQLSDDGSSYTDYTTFPVKRLARYVKVKISATTTSTFRVLAGSVRAWVNAVTRKENGVKAVGATGTPTVSLDGRYFTYKAIVATPVSNGAVAYYAVVDSIVMSTTGANSFDVYLFDASGTRVAGNVAWKFEGV